VSGDDRSLDTERIEQAEHVPDVVQQRVAVDFRRRIGLAVSSHVRRMARKPAAARTASWCRHEYHSSGKP